MPGSKMDDEKTLKRKQPDQLKAETSSSSSQKHAISDTPSSASSRMVDPADFDFLLKLYYKNFFPFKSMYNWLSYNGQEDDFFLRREFSFNFKGDIYARYKCFSTEEEFRSAIQKGQPYKIDIGAVYNLPPKNHLTVQAGSFQPLEKEMVFDIDMDDYDEVRTCCTGTNICSKCWVFIRIAIKVITRSMNEDFGFENVLWVYSGRRGAHCWVCDPRARAMGSDARQAMVSYLNVFKGSSEKGNNVDLPAISHPSLRRSYNIIRKVFESDILEEQEVMSDPDQINKVFKIVGHDSRFRGIEKDVRDQWNVRDLSSREKWDILESAVQEAITQKKVRNTDPIQDVVFAFTYPRLDIHVSTGLNHLLKSPFCVHPKTSRVCVPVHDPDTFDPVEVPTLRTLVDELDAYNAKHDDTMDMDNAMKTSLAPYIQYFEGTFLEGVGRSLNRERAAAKN